MAFVNLFGLEKESPDSISNRLLNHYSETFTVLADFARENGHDDNKVAVNCGTSAGALVLSAYIAKHVSMSDDNLDYASKVAGEFIPTSTGILVDVLVKSGDMTTAVKYKDIFESMFNQLREKQEKKAVVYSEILTEMLNGRPEDFADRIADVLTEDIAPGGEASFEFRSDITRIIASI